MVLFERELKQIVGEMQDYLDNEMTYKDLGHLADLSPDTISRLVQGKTKDPKFKTIWKLAKVAGVSVRPVKLKIYRGRTA